ncbi:hypothetical protein K490DRAFT_71059 [Saccharata proteae CBS 121410]|uniref:GIY-YIG domain-containing protein n=1 Tax=Saccharata proteae CBS 121410 TaxID=1314787 RepID=A0A9P4M2A9_9PEZI|nr:hypothetical protein K490DRAFT_71059 [Saccharata proteae CBS 121410]
MDKPIPAFYCCYLLRSTVRRTCIYVGSTPNPVRRLRQHNGHSKGGAVRTSRDSLRPWEMAVLVTGFPSKIAALQFEWAWQNTHLTRHIPTEDRITQSRMQVRVSPRSGKARKRPARPRASLTDKVANLHLLLRVKSFTRWPLHVRFFADDVHTVWEGWQKQTPFKLRADIPIHLENMKTDLTTMGVSDDLDFARGIHALDVTYNDRKAQLEQTRSLLEVKGHRCGVCKKAVRPKKVLAVVCPEQDCQTISHLTCLSKHFLLEDRNKDAMIPLEGHCPGCNKRLEWATMAKDLSLRVRGEREVEDLFKVRRQRKAKNGSATAAAACAENDEDEDEDEDDEERNISNDGFSTEEEDAEISD